MTVLKSLVIKMKTKEKKENLKNKRNSITFQHIARKKGDIKSRSLKISVVLKSLDLCPSTRICYYSFFTF